MNIDKLYTLSMYDKILKINIKGIEKEKITTILEDELNKKLQQSESRQRSKDERNKPENAGHK